VEVPHQGQQSGLIYRYSVDLLEAALKAGGWQGVLRERSHRHGEELNQGHWAKEMARGTAGYDVCWFMTSADRERRLNAVRVPMYQGLFGWRLLLTAKGTQARFSRLRGMADWRQIGLVQGPDWPDTEILRANGLRVSTPERYDTMLEWLRQGRVDAFPRAVVEAFVEAQAHPGIEVEPLWALHYPTALYFFVNRGRPALLATLRQGMEALASSGRLRQLFEARFATVLASADLGKRRILRLNNPLLPLGTPLKRSELWWEP
jgi:hypothetical protein